MFRKITLALFLFFIFPSLAYAADKNYATLVFPVRGREYWRQGRDISNLESLTAMVTAPSTWLIQYDALTDSQIMSTLKNITSAEFGLFLEVTRNLALDSFVNYPWETEKWERADKVFLSGYDPSDRFQLIDTAFSKFKSVLGFYPTSVGAWYIDSRSLEYLNRKYHVQIVLGVSDQYLTDGYQIWGQYIGEPYYPSLGSSIEPALGKEDKIGPVKIQWAAREPLLSYGAGVQFSNFSVQVNDYVRYQHQDRKYLDRLLRLYTTELDLPLSQITLGVEVGELESQFLPALSDEFSTAKDLGLTLATMSQFAAVYREAYPDTSPSYSITSAIGDRSLTWFQSPKYRAGVLKQNDKQTLVDLRQYHSSRFYDNDWSEADRRQNLYRVVPALVDQIGLGNSRPFDKLPEFSPQVPSLQPRLSAFDRFKLLLFRFIPDIRASKLDNHWVFGLATRPETLCFIGCSTYKYPVLEAFLSLRRSLSPNVKYFGAWQDTLPATGSPVIKNSPYGIDSLTHELLTPKSFENSYFLIHVRESFSSGR